MGTREIAKLKQSYIRDAEKGLQHELSVVEKKLFNAIFDKLITELEKSDGKIVSNADNVRLSTVLDEIFKSFEQNEYLKIINNFVVGINKIGQLNDKYFEIIAEDQKRFTNIKKEVNAIMRERIGINKEGNIKKDGYLDRLIKDNTLKQKIKETTFKAVTSGESFNKYVSRIETLTIGSKSVEGGLQKHFRQFAYDTYSQYNRTTSKLYAEKLTLTAFIYQGGEIATTRCFCKEKDGKVFTIEEAMKWRATGEDNCGAIMEAGAIYDPLTDLGGINCRHQTDYISNTTAIRLRPDLANIL